MDVDYDLVVPLSTIASYLESAFPAQDAFVNATPNGVVLKRASNSFMVAARARHPFWRYVLALCNPGKGVTSHRRVMTGTGPQVVDKALHGYAGKDVGVLPLSLFNPCDLCEKKPSGKLGTGGASCAAKTPTCALGCYAYHMNDGSWNSSMTRAFNGVFCQRWILAIVLCCSLVIVVIALSCCVAVYARQSKKFASS
jgi:hypothetical protein